MADVTYDARSFMIDGARQLLIMGEMHYARSPRALWPALLDRSVACGLNSVASYIFWNWHEPERDRYDFAGDHDLGYFLSLCAERDLRVLLRMGPYCCAEWNYGGYPGWLRDEPGITIRTMNDPYLRRVEKYFRHLCAEVRPYLATNGGPVVLAQVENEYANVAERYGEDGKRYLVWMAELARAQGIDVPVIMCEGAAPGVIETVNGHSISDARVATFRAQYPELPMVWTELWPAWYDTWGFQHHLRDPRNIAWHLLRFVGHGGSGWNYYMWHGGTNFDRTSMYLQTTSYDFGAPLDEYGRITLKGAYLARLHHLLAAQQQLLLAGERTREALPDGRVRISWRQGDAALTVEHDAAGHGRVLDATGQVLFDTAADYDDAQHTYHAPDWQPVATPNDWRCLGEPFPPQRDLDVVRADAPVEQLSLTHDRSDYCWYSSKLPVTAAGEQTLEITRGGDLLYLYVDGNLVGQTPPPFRENRGPTDPDTDGFHPANPLELQVQDGFRQTFRFAATAGTHRLDILAVALGLVKGDWSISASMNTERKGLWGDVRLNGHALTAWEMRPGLVGEQRAYVAIPTSIYGALPAAGRPCAWYRAGFSLPPETLAADADFRLDADGLGKGMLFLNGHALGRHWLISAEGYGADEGWQQLDTDALSLAPAGQPTQRWYHVPRSWLAEENTLIVFEEQPCLPTRVRLEMRG